jgi:hypothetical protein
MARKSNKSHWNLEDISDAEISAVIQYLDPDSRCDDSPPSVDFIPAIYLSLIFFIRELGRLHVPFPPNR